MKNRILVVEDDGPTCKLVDFHLAKGGLKTLPCDHLSTAFQWVETQEFKAILLDLNLRDSNTEETLAAIPKLARHCCVVFTGNPDPEVRIRALMAGAYGAVEKSKILQSPGALLEEITRASSQWEQDQATLAEVEEQGNIALARLTKALERMIRERLDKQDRSARWSSVWKHLSIWGQGPTVFLLYLAWNYFHPGHELPFRFGE